MVAGYDLADSLPYGRDSPRSLVPEGVRQKAIRSAPTAHFVQLGMANAGKCDVYEHLPGLKRRELKRAELQWIT